MPECRHGKKKRQRAEESRGGEQGRRETILRVERRQDSTYSENREREHTKRGEAEGVLVACRQLIECH